MSTFDINDFKEPDSLPTDVKSKEELSLLPEQYISNDPKRPLYLHPYKYSLKPLYYSVLFILIVEALERFTYYGIGSTETAFLSGAYNQNWSPNMTDQKAASYTSTSTGIAYSAPFIGGLIADGFLGDFWTIVMGVSLLYIPGLVLISLSTFPGLLGPTFNVEALTAGLLVLMPLGTGFIKSVVNVFGAKQYHPLLQSKQLETYYINFYLSINIGSLLGTVLIPILAEIRIELAYLIPTIALVVGLIIFLLGSKRYVRRPPENKVLLKTTKLLVQRAFCKPFDAAKKSYGGTLEDAFVNGVKRLLLVIPVCLLTLPFFIGYSQMSTVFVLQGEAMEKAGLLDASLMTSFDPISVLISGFLAGSFFYPALSKRGIRIPLTYKFAIGTSFAATAIGAAIVVDHFIRSAYDEKGARISILWQAFQYFLIGFGEIFAVTSGLEAAFSIAPKEQKGFASAINLFMTSGLSSFICVGLNGALASWFPQEDAGESTTERYAKSGMGKFLWVTFGITVIGIVINVIPPVRNWAENLYQESIIDAAAETSSDHGRTTDESDTSSIEKDVEDIEYRSTTH